MIDHFELPVYVTAINVPSDCLFLTGVYKTYVEIRSVVVGFKEDGKTPMIKTQINCVGLYEIQTIDWEKFSKIIEEITQDYFKNAIKAIQLEKLS